MSFLIKQPLYKRFSLDQQCPQTSPTSYLGPPSLNRQFMMSSPIHLTHESTIIKHSLYTIFSKPQQPVTNQ
ncbi:unnamed protein product [Adineta ricciae]|uniref:Uncharacterized protein n=1 Tax=Adineta ricciae TaxID=249248 RepID=A0A814XLY6_ADIRI|nr:unnamed protein product [Adineta ricciae]